MSLSEANRTLVEAARDIIARRSRDDYHETGVALRSQSGQTFSAVHLKACVGRVAVCAEAIALGPAAAGDADVEAIVAVNRAGEVVAPCGMCRELASGYAPSATVVVPGDPELEEANMAALLPRKYERTT